MKLTYLEDTYVLDKLFQLRSGEIPNIEITKELLANKVMVVFEEDLALESALI
jgi:2-C-methyl-D-erythritol 4-phosphate cytidylyltransferase